MPAACSSTAASAWVAASRCCAVIPRSDVVPNLMHNCLGCAAGSGFVPSSGELGVVFMGGLVDSALNTDRASPMPMLDEQAVQIAERLDGHLRWPEFHGSASSRVQHPPGHDENYAGLDFDMDDLTRSSPLAVLALEASAV